MRLHVATFDSRDGADYNAENCAVAADLFSTPRGVTTRFWCELIVAKRLNARYQSGDRSPTWLKIKCTKRREFIVVGWRTNEQGEDLRAFHLAEEIDGKIVYRGRVGSGITEALRPELLGAVEMIEIDEPVLTVPREERKLGWWIEPRLVVDVAFTEVTEEGTLRHPSFKGMRVR